MNQVLPKKTSLHFLYENKIGRIFFNEESRSIWTGCKKPYKAGVVSLAAKDPMPIPDKDNVVDLELRSTYINSIPRCKNYRGLLLQGYLISPKFLRELPQFEVRPDDVFVCSYPRSGTTWMEEIVSCITTNFDSKFMKKKVHDRVIHLEVGRTFNQGRHLRGLKSPRLLSTHLPLSHCPDQLKDLKCKVIYVARNPKDQAVSYFYFHSTAKYLGRKKWDWNTFLDLYTTGQLVYGSWFQHVRDWYLLSRERPDRVLFVTYEELQVNLEAMLIRIADFLQIQLESETAEKIARHCRFSQMKKNPAVNREEIPVTDLFVPSEFMRKGIIGDWKNHFTSVQSQLFDQFYTKEMSGLGLKFAYDAEQALAMIGNRVTTASSSPAPTSETLHKGQSEASIMSASTELMIEQSDQKPITVTYRKSRPTVKPLPSAAMLAAIDDRSSRESERVMTHSFLDEVQEAQRIHEDANQDRETNQSKDSQQENENPVQHHDAPPNTSIPDVGVISAVTTDAVVNGKDESSTSSESNSRSPSTRSRSVKSEAMDYKTDKASYAVVTGGRLKCSSQPNPPDKRSSPSLTFERMFPISYEANADA